MISAWYYSYTSHTLVFYSDCSKAQPTLIVSPKSCFPSMPFTASLASENCSNSTNAYPYLNTVLDTETYTCTGY